MSINKYANLPDIDTAPDIYETEDAFPSDQLQKPDGDDDEVPATARSKGKGESQHEGVDSNKLMSPEEATKRFRKAEKRRVRPRVHYTYPPSPSSPLSSEDEQDESEPFKGKKALSQRLLSLQAELASLEAELADPTNPMLQKEREERNIDPGELIRGLVDVRGRLEKIRKGKEGRGKLVGIILDEDDDNERKQEKPTLPSKTEDSLSVKPEVTTLIEMDQRLSELEKAIGTSTAALDESSPLPSPLLPLLSRMHSQLGLLTQPRHIDSISRRLKLLLSDLDRISSAQQIQHKRHPSQQGQPTGMSSQTQEQLLPLLSRLGPSLPQIPHILTRLRTLSTLHTSAGEFQSVLEGLEEEQRKLSQSLQELDGAIKTVEHSLEENKTVSRANVEGLESRLNELFGRLDTF